LTNSKTGKIDKWKDETLRSLLEPSGDVATVSLDEVERGCRVRDICSGIFAEYAHTLTEEVAVHLRHEVEGALPPRPSGT
jgi:hypothetical protein